MAVELRCEAARGRRYAAAMRRDAELLMRLLGVERCELSLLLVGDRAMRRLDRRWRGKDRPTDVLSFSQLEGGTGFSPRPKSRAKACATEPAPLLGDVVISVDTAIRQARRLRLAPPARIRTLLIHGLLHLLGYDHERSAAEARRMFRREQALAAKLDAAGGTGRACRNDYTRACRAGGLPAPR